jgi:hypothetical protein
MGLRGPRKLAVFTGLAVLPVLAVLVVFKGLAVSPGLPVLAV